MHDEISVVIPGAKNKAQAEMNLKASELEDISSLLPAINSIMMSSLNQMSLSVGNIY